MANNSENSNKESRIMGNGDINVPISAESLNHNFVKNDIVSSAAFYQQLISVINLSVDKEINDILNDITLKFSQESKQRSKHPSGHIPQILQGGGKDDEAILQLMKFLIEFENFDSEEADKSRLIHSLLPSLDSVSKWSIVGQSLSSYVSLLDLNHLKNLATRILSDVALWMCRIFKYPDGVSHYHDDEKEGVVKICRLNLHKKYPKYSTDGYEVLYTRPPVIYISSASKHNLGHYICNQIGLPHSCLCTVPCRLGHLDLDELIKLIEEDQKAGKNPIIVVAYAGTPLLGQTDNLGRLVGICKANDIWLHLEGNGLSMLAFQNVPTVLDSATLCDSMTLNLGAWLGLPSVPYITLFKSPDVVLTRLVNLSTFNVRYKLACTSLWLTMLHLGYDRILARIQYHIYLSSAIFERISKINSSNELITLPLESPTVIFRYQIKNVNNNEDVMDAENNILNIYCDTLNLWLAETLKRESAHIQISTIEVDGMGLCLRYAPLEFNNTYNTCTLFDTTLNDLEQFLEVLEHHIHVLDATVSMRKRFEKIVGSQNNIRIIHLPTWAGLGAVQYIPDMWLSQISNLSEIARHEINVLNNQMVQQLRSTDSAFSLGITENEMQCVRFGLVTEDMDLEELVKRAYTTGKDVEESSRYLESMADVIKKGIEIAAEDLLKESQEKLLQEGVLRQVPIVSSILNWWSPPPKDIMKGRTFNLQSGIIASTEGTYTSHMQILDTTDHLPKNNLKSALHVEKNLERSNILLENHLDSVDVEELESADSGVEHVARKSKLQFSSSDGE